MGLKKTKRICGICLNHDHCKNDCPHLCEPCSKEDVCKKFCMVDLSTKLHKLISKFKHVSRSGSNENMKRAFEKLEYFEDVIESTCAYHEGHMGRRCQSCSSKKRVKMLMKSCTKLREKYEDEFESSDDDDWWDVPMPMIEVKEIAKGKSQVYQ